MAIVTVSTSNTFNEWRVVTNQLVTEVNKTESGTAALSVDTLTANTVTANGDIAVNGGDLTTTQTTANVFNTTATTLNLGGAATTVEIGAATGTTNVNNNLDVDGDLNVDGGDITVSTSTANLLNTTATTVNFAGAATTLELGAATGNTNINNNLIVDGNTTVSSLTTNNGVVFATNSGKLNTNSNIVWTGTVLDVNGNVSARYFDAVNGVNLNYGTANTIPFLDSARALTSNTNLSWNGTTLGVTGNQTVSGTLGVTGNVTLSGELRGPSTFTIDPAVVGDDTGTVVIKGNLQVDGTTTTINSTTLTVDDLNIVLASGAANAAAANGAGITIDGASATITYLSSGDKFSINKAVDFAANPILTGGTANGVAYLNSSKVLTTGSSFAYDGTRLTISANAALPSAGSVAGTNLWTVGADATTNAFLLDAFGSNSTLVLRRASGTSASPTAVTSGSSIANIGARGYGATGYSSGNRASINISATETWTDSAQGTRIAFNTTSNGSATLSERVSIENTGDVVVNSGATINESGGDFDFRVESDTKTHMLFVDASGDSIGINNSSPTPAFVLDIVGNATSGGRTVKIVGPDTNTSTGTSAPQVVIGNSSNTTGNYVKLGFQGSAGVEATSVNAKISDHSNGYGTIIFNVRGAVHGYQDRMSIGDTAIVINDEGLDMDFRVESDNNANMFFVDGGTDQVVIGGSTPYTTSTLTVYRYGSSSSNNAEITIDANANSGTGQASLKLISGSGSTNRATRLDFFNGVNSTSTPRWTLINDYDQNGTNDFRIVGAGASPKPFITIQNGTNGIIFNEDSYDQDFRVESDGATHMLFVDASTNRVGVGTGSPDSTLHVYQGNGQIKIENPADGMNATWQITGSDSRFGTQTNIPLDVYTNATRAIRITGGQNVLIGTTSDLAKLTVAGNVFPSADNTYDLGSASYSWANVYTGDLHLSNMKKETGNEIDGTKGDWTIQEGENDLFILNNRTGKKYKFKLEEIQ